MSEQYQDSASGLTIKNYEILPDGTLKCWVRLAKTGVYDYGSHQQVIESSELFNQDSLNTLVGQPITLEHPPSFILTTQDRKQHQIGTILQEFVKEIDNDVEYLAAPVIVWEDSAIESIKNKKINQFSPGYYADKEEKDGKIYQRNRRYNHVALTEMGRGGDKVCALVDSVKPTTEQPKVENKNNVTLTETMQVDNSTTVTPDKIVQPGSVPPTPIVVPQTVPAVVPDVVPTQQPTTPAQTPPAEVVKVDRDAVAALVKIHAQYHTDLITAGIEPDYSWSAEELKRRVVAVKTGKDATQLSESQCDAILNFLVVGTVQDSVILPNKNQQQDSVSDAEKKRIERIENAYKRGK